ncbi:MAG: hypothetical protein KKB50_14895 [Planctomycetes bacterium]|nr:hypothetical protein [Planctomycetota bacterium]
MRRSERLVRGLATGAITLGILQALEAINFSEIWATILNLLFQTIVAVLFGGDLGSFSV